VASDVTTVTGHVGEGVALAIAESGRARQRVSESDAVRVTVSAVPSSFG
jgi:hypothetical protein